MKNIKKYILTCLVLLLANTGIAQSLNEQLVVPLSSPNEPGLLEVGLIKGSITVKGYDGDTVIINSESPEKKVSKKTTNGMTKISGGSVDLRAEERNNKVSIHSNSWKNAINLEIQVPKNFSLKLSCINKGKLYVENVNGEMEVSNINGSIDMLNVSGSVVANTTNGHIKVVFNKVSANTNMAFSSFNKNVDITLPALIKANIKAKTDGGDIYTDFDMDVDSRKPVVEKGDNGGNYKVKIEQWTYGKINGGGPEILMKSFNGDLYIRKK
ncbi:DUF4097 family beta strand repeat-containing protein [Spongiivirga citrea]|uniref:DUF4097 family beta strand repeat protein n=1 Tax=Spongiivirga citrea TaxID=1481457 RepID=A0A6M0CRW8_9FLAO|nr:DUF4097 domain-containing protein [Spongiivirga citrea]NER16650.1 hypothetical protein [Spongiivirga citrea]